MAIVLFIGLAYIRHSYYINPGAPFFIDKDQLDIVSMKNHYALPSMLIFIVLFGLANAIAGLSFSFHFMKYLVVIYISLVAASALFYGLNVFLSQKWAFSFGSHIKNFCLGPVYPIAAYFIYKLKK